MKEVYYQSDRGKVYYQYYENPSNKTCLVFTHGLTADGTMFDKQVEYFKDSYSVLVWDVPMHGKSRPYANFMYKNVAEDLHQILLAEEIEKPILVGMSMGGYVSQMYINLYPENVKAFVSIDSTPFGTVYYSVIDKWLLERVSTLFNFVPERTLKRMLMNGTSCTTYGREVFATILEKLTKQDIIDQTNIAYGVFMHENKDIVFTMPVLLLLGDKDKTGKVAQYNKQWAEKENFPLVIVENAAHMSNVDNYEQVNTEIENFIKDL